MDQNKKQYIVSRIKELHLKVRGCQECGGTGLIRFISYRNDAGVIDHIWGGEYCKECAGLGFFLPDEDHILFFCQDCHTDEGWRGNWCETCHSFGVVDWIQNVTRSVVNDRYL